MRTSRLDTINTQDVTVYTKPNCSQCEMTHCWLRARHVDHQLADITEPGNLEAAKSLGSSTAPVVNVSQGDSTTEQPWACF